MQQKGYTITARFSTCDADEMTAVGVVCLVSERKLVFLAVRECFNAILTCLKEVRLNRSHLQELATTLLTAIILSILVSWGAVYGLNLYLGPIEDPAETTGSFPAAPPD